MMIHDVNEDQAENSRTIGHEARSERKIAFDYLRALAVVLVLLHHAVLAYTLSASTNLENPIATPTPVVNDLRWPIFDLLVMYNETFLMPLLFFVSGLFVWGSVVRKGACKFLRDRLIRLGLPFAIGVLFLIPLAYFPAQLQAGQITGVNSSFGEFWLEMIRSGFGTAGPLWFLWLLLGFNYLAVLVYRAAPFLGDLIRKRTAVILGSPAAFFGVLLGFSIAAYLPMAISIGPLEWMGIGPFQVQVSRIALYLIYFLAGTVIGAYGIERTLFRWEGPLAQQPWRWLAVSLVSFIVFATLVVVVTAADRTIASEIAFALCGAATVLGLTALLLRFVQRPAGLLTNLSENSYGIYLVHYVYATWLQYALLETPLAPSLKGMVVFGGTLTLSWGTAAAIRRLPMAAKVI